MEHVAQFLLNDIDVLKDVVIQLNSWDGSLEHLQVYENDEEFFDMFFEGKPMEAVRACCYGDYEFMNDYVRINAYGNLESLSAYDYEQELKDSIDEIVDSLIDNRHNLSLDAELEELLDENDEDEED